MPLWSSPVKDPGLSGAFRNLERYEAKANDLTRKAGDPGSNPGGGMTTFKSLYTKLKI